jgi:hypothetical protein
VLPPSSGSKNKSSSNQEEKSTALLVTFLLYSLTLKMEAGRSSEKLENLCRTIRRHIPESSTLYGHRFENLKFNLKHVPSDVSILKSGMSVTWKLCALRRDSHLLPPS